MFKDWLMLNRNIILQNFPFLEDDFDALDDYTLFCKFIGYVEKVFINNERFLKELKDNLNTMYEEGKFDSLIEEIVNLQLTFTYPSIASMKLATNLVNGSFAKTTGFYSYNDGGGSYYYVRTKTEEDTVDDVTIVGLSDETLVAELLIEDVMNVKEFGAKGDGETDDTEAIQLCFDTVKNIVIRDGVYMIDADTGVYPKSDSNINLVNATLKAITNDSEHYGILYINNVNNVRIDGGIIEGERSTHTGLTGEWGMGIYISGGSSNIYISNIIIKDCWGDGIYINNGVNINTQNVVCDNNRRQGISIISVNGYHSLNDKLINTNGTSPESGIDIEPNSASDRISNIILENLYTENNNGIGIDIWLPRLDNTSTYPATIKIINHHDIGSKTGERIGGIKANTRHNILSEDSLLENNNTGISLRETYDNEKDKILIVKPKIVNCNYDTTVTPAYVCGIAGYTTDDTTTQKIGGVTIINPYITSAITETIRRSITFYDTTGTNRANNIDIINPLNKQDNLNIAIYGDNITFTDIFNKYKYTGNYNISLEASALYSLISNINYNPGRTTTLNANLPIGYRVTFINEKAGYRFKIQFANNDYCKYFNDNTGNLINSGTMNSLITLRKISEHEWIVENIIGEFTVSE